jgi:hypothetical protein
MLRLLVQLLIQRLAADLAKPVGKHGGDRKSEERESDARIKKDRPDIAEASQETQSMLADETRQIARYDFEGGGFVEVVFSSDIDIEEALETIETMIRLKRAEIARRKERALASQK